MIETYLLEQLVAVAECGTLSSASEKLHLTQPTVTRSMQKLEEEIGVKLFVRSKNRVTLNENGQLAAACARHILMEYQGLIDRVRALDRSQHTITVGSSMPGPMMELLPKLSALYPEWTISTETKPEEYLLQGLKSGMYQLIFPHSLVEDTKLHECACGTERLYAGPPEKHPLAGKKSVR